MIFLICLHLQEHGENWPRRGAKALKLNSIVHLNKYQNF